jgi:hypothetical protein
MKRAGRKSAAQTPAPKKDQIKGSSKNPKGSASSKKSAKSIKFNDALINTIKLKVSEHNKSYPTKKVNVNTAKAVVRRGMGAYSTSYRPTISGGRPNSRTAWGIARLNTFLKKKAGKKVKKAYVQDDDLL